MKYDVDAIKRAALGKTLDILHDLCGVPEDVVDAALARTAAVQGRRLLGQIRILRTGT